MLRKLCFGCVIFLYSSSVFTQDMDGFTFVNPNQRSLKIKFELVNNLMIIPLKINGVELSFLLDSGVDKTLLIALEKGDSLDLNKTRKINIRGLGKDDNYEAYLSVGNTLEIKNAINTNQKVYYIIDKNSALTRSLGLPVNGIIGYDFFKNFIVRIDYKTTTIKLYNPAFFKRNLPRYEILPLQFYRNKPYVNLIMRDETLSKSNFNLLVDTGNGGSFWLLENDSIDLPKLHFEDILGYGISSIIQGKRAKVNQVNLGKYRFSNPNVAYPDAEQIHEIENNLKRDGSLGAEILRRFKLFFDYPNKRLYILSNSSLNDSFNYDMSGLVFEFDGVKLVEEFKRVKMNTSSKSNSNNSEFNSTSTSNLIISVGIKPKISVKAVRKNSPAEEVDILLGDELLKINGKNAYTLELKEIQSILAKKEGNKLKLEFLRNEKKIKREFYLRDRFQDLLINYKN